MDFKLIINNQGSIVDVTNLCEGNIRLTSERKGGASKLEFRVMKHESLSFFEGNQVTLHVKDTPMFLGYIFKKNRTKDQLISVTAYDQMRYLKNKDTYVYENKTASEVLRMIADDFNMSLGNVSDTGYVIPGRSEDSQTLMDIIYNALDLTLINTGDLYILYDDFGSLTLKNMKDMQINEVISAAKSLIDYNYTTDIDSETYNKIKLVKDNEDAGKREVFIEMDSGNMQKWGILQHYEKVDENLTESQIIQLAQKSLKVYNRVKRTLSLDNLEGNLQIRGGSSLFFEIENLGDISLSKLLVVRKCVHTFANNEHTMKLDLEGLD